MNAASGGWRSQQEVPIPRAIDPQRFASAREPEILAIADALKKSEFGEKYGIEGMPRHLRRRAKSHNPYTHRMRPNAKKAAVLATGQSQIPGGSIGGAGESPQAGSADEATPPTSGTAQGPPPLTNRKMRRRPGKLNEAALACAQWSEDTLAAFNVDDSPGNPHVVRRLETHIWHAKRFAMKRTWAGWVLPEAEPGLGRGSRSFLHRLSSSAVLHDASYWCPLVLSGEINDVLRCLKLVIDPEIAEDIAKIARAITEPSHDVQYSWQSEEREAVLHQPGQWPRGTISPVQIIPLRNLTSGNSDCNGCRQLCIWVHGAAAADAFSALKTVAASQMSSEGTNNDPCEVKILDLRRIEIRGKSSDAALCSALFNRNTNSSDSQVDLVPEELQMLRPGQAFHTTLHDPRLRKPVTLGSSSSTLSTNPNNDDCGFQDLFGATGEHMPPLPESVIAAARQQLRRRMVQGEEIEDDKSGNRLLLDATTIRCSAMLIRQRSKVSGWSIILPPGWVAPIWLALVFQGCRATGQREWRWAHILDERPFFPHDFPDSDVCMWTVVGELMGRISEEGWKPRGKVTLPAPQFNWNLVQSLGLSSKSVIENRFKGSNGGAKRNGNGDAALVMEGDREGETKEDRQGAGGGNEPMELQNLDEIAEEGTDKQIYIARSEASMLRAVFGPRAADGGPICRGTGARPVANALAAGKLHWVPRKRQDDALFRLPFHEICLVETSVQFIKRGTAREGAMVCVIDGAEAEHSTQPCYLREKEAKAHGQRHIPPDKISIIGFVTSTAPYGTGRARASLAACSAAAFWRLRSLQYYKPRRDEGMVEAWIANHQSSVLFPVRLLLLVEK